MERIIDVTTARRQFGTLLDEVFHKGDVVTVQRKGRSLAKIVPIEKKTAAQVSARQKALLEELDSLPALAMNEDPAAVLGRIREQKRIQGKKKYGG